MNNNLIPLNKDPIKLFAKWYTLAKKNELNDPNAMNLATVSKNNKPSSRIVLLKYYSDKGFEFYTNSFSKKGREIDCNNSVALNFYWKSLQKQIRIEGKVFKIEKHRSEEYFQSRPTESKIGAWASSQSKLLKNRSELIKKFKEKNKKFLNKVIDRPVHWSGYIVVPKLIEFWNQKPHRLHDRVEYRKKRIGWVSKNLYP
tara:strand:- start:621 stop:1220 length:600 start_codon:yes stop_codon:yes gene_type:complete